MSASTGGISSPSTPPSQPVKIGNFQRSRNRDRNHQGETFSGQAYSSEQVRKINEHPTKWDWNINHLLEFPEPMLYPCEFHKELNEYRTILKNDSCGKKLIQATKLIFSTVGGAVLLSKYVFPFLNIVDSTQQVAFGALFAAPIYAVISYFENQEEKRKVSALLKLNTMQNDTFAKEYQVAAQELLKIFLVKFPFPGKQFTSEEIAQLQCSSNELKDQKQKRNIKHYHVRKEISINTSTPIREKFITDIKKLAKEKLPKIETALDEAFGLVKESKLSCYERIKSLVCSCFCRRNNQVKKNDKTFKVNPSATLIEPLEAAISIILLEIGEFETFFKDSETRNRYSKSLRNHEFLEIFFNYKKEVQIENANQIFLDVETLEPSSSQTVADPLITGPSPFKKKPLTRQKTRPLAETNFSAEIDLPNDEANESNETKASADMNPSYKSDSQERKMTISNLSSSLPHIPDTSTRITIIQ